MPKHKLGAAQPSSVRIIAGEWRGRRLSVLTRNGLRPTADRVRETLFNWLAPDIHGARCLDLFAGTGALGFESLSRGARFVEFCEIDSAAARLIAQNLENLTSAKPREADARVSRVDALTWLERYTGEPFDIIFLDPPFAAPHLLSAALEHIRKGELLVDNGLLYLEFARHGQPFTTNDPKQELQADSPQAVSAEGLECYRLQTAGKVRFGLYIFKGAGD